MSEDSAAPPDRLDAIAASLAGVAAALEQQREDLRLALEVLVELASKVDRMEQGTGADLAPQVNGVEVGALMGATQAAWLRLEQRLESEFSDIHRELRTLTGQTAHAAALPPSPRTGAGSDQLRRAAASLRSSLRGVRRR